MFPPDIPTPPPPHHQGAPGRDVLVESLTFALKKARKEKEKDAAQLEQHKGTVEV